MPLRSSSEPPKVMTWPKAAPVLVAAAVIDLLRAFFNFFWFFGPAIAAIYCAVKATDTLAAWSFGFLGAKTAAAVCTAGAAVIGAVGVEMTVPFGAIMADAVGLMGFLALGLWISVRNLRILKVVSSAPLQFAGAFAIGEVPLLGALPFFSYILWRLYGKQIRVETAALKKWRGENAAALQQQQSRQALRVAQIKGAQQAQFMQQQAANDAAAAEAANDGIPGNEQLAA